MLVFNGATVTAEQSWAFIENMGVSRISIVHPGDAIAHGIITRIALDFLEYEADGKVIRVAIGQNLVGQATGDATMPAVSVSTTNPSSGSPGEDILERRRRARLRELGQ